MRRSPCPPRSRVLLQRGKEQHVRDAFGAGDQHQQAIETDGDAASLADRTERFELYAAGLELANGFSELCDSREQRRRLVEEQEQRRGLGREVFPLDEKFLAALDRIGEAGGVAVGFDRLLMLLTGAETIADVLLFPAAEEYAAARDRS